MILRMPNTCIHSRCVDVALLKSYASVIPFSQRKDDVLWTPGSGTKTPMSMARPSVFGSIERGLDKMKVNCGLLSLAIFRGKEFHRVRTL